MSYTIHKLTYSDGRAFRYHISDEAGNLGYVAERTGMLLPSPTYLVEFFDPDHNPSGRLQPPDVAPWRRGMHYELFVGAEEVEEPYAVIQETWRLVDILLLRLPRYEIQLGKHCYIVQGSRYGGQFYEIFLPWEDEQALEENEETEAVEAAEGELPEEDKEESEPDKVKVGEIRRPKVGPSYTVEVDAAPLRQSPLALAATVILIDMEVYS
ncbi:MAG: hypothetical protein DRJ03_29940 [Chloroflexi bacterium]|nr:MAG: hypothetical protein B6I35_04700 [Anaerolineaceae bacterium 4572_32.2]RLC71569.1 MAG: hypothetical protein DRI81_17560 [Chloroflexota bacterium]RLC75645.1 MAG: hypothetical protein DRJ03_29940 [Chloroflexota bacterium]HEY72886.1 hypothetical protein [Thermoflexia bacterium]